MENLLFLGVPILKHIRVYPVDHKCILLLDDCDSGYELKEDGGCNPCIRGSYRNKVLHYACQNCTNGKTTYTDKSVKVEDCIMGECRLKSCSHFCYSYESYILILVKKSQLICCFSF